MNKEPLTHVTVSFFPVSDSKTEIHLIHSGWGSTSEWERAREWFEKGWEGSFKVLERIVNEKAHHDEREPRKMEGLEIRHAAFIRADPARVYDSLTTAKGLDGWFTHGSIVEARPGGKIIFRWKNWGADKVTAEDGGPVLEAKRPEVFTFQWQPDNKSYMTTVRFTLEPSEGGTIIRVKEEGYKDTLLGRKAMLGCATGWGEALTLLKFYVEHGISY